VADYFALERNVTAVAGTMFLMGLGEELWKRFVPKYLEALGAPVAAVGLYGSARDLLDGLYQYPGGWVADRLGRRRALLLFVSLATLGYALYLLAPTWPVVFVGLLFVMAWSSMASPTLFAVVGDALPQGRRAMGFTVQSILRRVPMAAAPTLGGLAIATYGVPGGVRVGLAATILLAGVTFAVAARVRVPLVPQAAPTKLAGVWRALPTTLRRLLLVAFVVGGLREIGEPARKALIVDLAEPHLRARSVGLYYLVRSLAVSPAALVGGALWAVAPRLPFVPAAPTAAAGTVVFALTVREGQAA
jgi:MFS family permease